MQEQLRRGWTTGACATAAVKAALYGMIHQQSLESIAIDLPKINNVNFALHRYEFSKNYGFASVIKDAGDDPDVTHGLEICAEIRPIDDDITHDYPMFCAGEGVGTVTMSGLPIAVGDAAITPKPREMIIDNITQVNGYDKKLRYQITISIPNGKEIAEQTWNGRLGVKGGLSILGTTGVVIPYSCSAWIHAIHRGIDVAVANNIQHIGAGTGKTSQALLEQHYGFNIHAVIDMGDFIGATIKYVQKTNIESLHIIGGIGKMAKCAQGAMDLHSHRSQLDIKNMLTLLYDSGFQGDIDAHYHDFATAMQFYELAQTQNINIASIIAKRAQQHLLARCDRGLAIKITIINRNGDIIHDGV